MPDTPIASIAAALTLSTPVDTALILSISVGCQECKLDQQAPASDCRAVTYPGAHIVLYTSAAECQDFERPFPRGIPSTALPPK